MDIKDFLKTIDSNQFAALHEALDQYVSNNDPDDVYDDTDLNSPKNQLACAFMRAKFEAAQRMLEACDAQMDALAG